MNRDLFLAILSMDSYNRGYGRGIKFSVGESTAPRNESGVQIGNATVLAQSNVADRTDAVTAGFYGIAYVLPAVTDGAGNIITPAETVIAFRGTDDNIGGEKTGGSDLYYGYDLAIGAYAAPQAQLARAFYQAVAGVEQGANPFEANISVTGHSLGGGLAGHVGALYGKSGIIFDNMTFELATSLAYAAASLNGSVATSLYGATPPEAPDATGLSAYAVEYEFLAALRATSGQSLRVTPLDSDGEGLNPFTQYHSMALLVNLLWARDNVAGDDWRAAAPYLWSSYFDPEIAAAIPLAGDMEGPTGDAASALRTAIAYSAIDEGTLVFGNTGIYAMFNDANDLGGVLKAPGHSGLIDRSAAALAQLFVQYAGKLAIDKVTDDAAARLGVIEDIGGEVLVVDLSSATWDKGAAHTTIVGRRTLIGEALSQTETDLVLPNSVNGFVPMPPVVRSDLLTGLNWLYADKPGYNAADPTTVIDRVILKSTDGPLTLTLPERRARHGDDGITLLASGDGADVITGSADAELLHGGAGSDFLRGGDGDDLLAGGSGDDVLSGGTGRDFIAGGAGTDIYDLRFEGVSGGIAAGLSLVPPAEGSTDRTVAQIALRSAASAAAPTDVNRFVDVETVRFTDAADALAIVAPARGDFGDLAIDFGGQADGAFDVIDFRSWSKDVSVDLARDTVSWQSGGIDLNPFIEGRSFETTQTLTVRNAEAVLGGSGNDELSSGGAASARTILLDGGAGNDDVTAIGGERATTIGGLGKDWIYNTSKGGIIWGDIANSVERSDGSRVAVVDGVAVTIADTRANSDNFWWSAGSTIMDAQKRDVIKFYGIALTGGDTIASTTLLALGGGFGMLGGGVIGAAGLAQLRGEVPESIFYDRFMPFVTYKLVAGSEAGTQDLLIYNALNPLARLLSGDLRSDAPVSFMRVVDYDRGGENGVADRYFSRPGELGLSFEDVSPLALLSAVAPFMAGIPIAQSVFQGLMAQVMGYTLAYMGFQIGIQAVAAGWKQDGDPLVIDLDGDGLETIGLRDSRAYFDIDGDLFREKSGWLRGDDGFLVHDANRNGRIDDITEMFGNQTTGGFAALAAYDSNGDGKVTAADLLWGDLQIWQDRDGDGQTDAGELRTLQALGIVELNLATRPLNLPAANGAALLSYGDVTFAGGRISSIYEAIFTSDNADTRYGGEAGRAPWQAHSTSSGQTVLNAKGFGTVTDLAVAMANDVGLATLAQSRSTAMLTPDLRTLVAQAGDVLGRWGMTRETSRELLAVRLSATGERRCIAAANDNSAWRKAPFRLHAGAQQVA